MRTQLIHHINIDEAMKLNMEWPVALRDESLELLVGQGDDIQEAFMAAYNKCRGDGGEHDAVIEYLTGERCAYYTLI